MRLGPGVGRRTTGSIDLPGLRRAGGADDHVERDADQPPAPGRGQAGGQAADQEARAADEGGRRSTTSTPAASSTSWSSSTSPRRTGSTSARWSVSSPAACDARIDLRQVGSRDAARLTGGMGNCGRDLCCATFLKDFEPVSLRMAKVQDLPPNPMKISGACGRLMCCLKYEHPLYVEFAREVPAVGASGRDRRGRRGRRGPPGAGRRRAGPDDGQRRRSASCSRASVCGSRQAYETRPEPAQAPAEVTAGAGSDPSAPKSVGAIGRARRAGAQATVCAAVGVRRSLGEVAARATGAGAELAGCWSR